MSRAKLVPTPAPVPGHTDGCSKMRASCVGSTLIIPQWFPLSRRTLCTRVVYVEFSSEEHNRIQKRHVVWLIKSWYSFVCFNNYNVTCVRSSRWFKTWVCIVNKSSFVFFLDRLGFCEGLSISVDAAVRFILYDAGHGFPLMKRAFVAFHSKPLWKANAWHGSIGPAYSDFICTWGLLTNFKSQVAPLSR